MTPKTRQMMEKSPHPVRWGLSMVIWLALALIVHNVFFVMFGITVGFYFGNYQGRRAIVEAWQNELKEEYESKYGPISDDFIASERERIQRQEVCSDKTHWH